ncbi:MAG: hypothetical protein V2B14_05220 [bacterium]
MSRIELLMKQLGLESDLIKSTISKIEGICQNYYEEDVDTFYRLELGGNGDGNN